MSAVALRSGAGTAGHATLDPGDAQANSCAISLSEPAGNTQRWRLEIHAEIEGQRDRVLVGVIRTLPPSALLATAPNRLVAIANCPGASRWHVVAQAIGEEIEVNARATLSLSACRPMLGADGAAVLALSGSRLESEGTYNHASGTGDATVTLPPNAVRVTAWSATADGADGTVEITRDGVALDLITIRDGDAFEDSPRALYAPCSLEFADLDTWWVEWLEL